MELHAKDIIPLHGGGKISSVAGDCRGLFRYRSAVGMGVINESAIRNAAQQPRAIANGNPVPAYVRRLDRSREARTFSGKQSGPRSLRGFGAALKQPLHAYADSQ